MYGFDCKLNASFDDVRRRVETALADEGFGVLTEIDVKAVMKKKLDKDMRHYSILGACNPDLASQAIDAEPDIGLLLPCNVLIRTEEDGSQTVSFMDPIQVLGLVGREDIEPLARDVRARLERVRDAIQT